MLSSPSLSPLTIVLSKHLVPASLKTLRDAAASVLEREQERR